MDQRQRVEAESAGVAGVGALKRRGLIAGLAALAAAGLAKLAGPERAEATHSPMTGTPAADTIALHVGQTNPATAQTTLSTTTGGGGFTLFKLDNHKTAGNALEADGGPGAAGLLFPGGGGIVAKGGDNSLGLAVSTPGDGGVAVLATGGNVNGGVGRGGPGVSATGGTSLGSFAGGDGVSGKGGQPNGVGVFGQGGGGGHGVFGFTQGDSTAGVAGENSQSGAGVRGLTASTTHAGVEGINTGNGVGVQGLSHFDGTGPGIGVHGKSAGVAIEGDSINSTGVIGRATAAGNPQPGVLGSATNGYGVFGFSANSNGIAGQSGTSAAGCVGFAGAPGGYGIYGGTAVQGGYAGGFAGPVLVVGDFTATGGAKSAAVPHPDGSHRRLYSLESPESWFEDFGEARLVNGSAQVKLDPDFLAVVHNDKYFVFLTEVGDSGGLYVSGQSPTGFEVRARGSASAGGSFYYRVVAKRKDIAAPRLEKVKLPQPIKELVKPDLPKPAEPPKAPAGPERPGR